MTKHPRLKTLKPRLQTLKPLLASARGGYGAEALGDGASWRAGKTSSTARGYTYAWQQARAAFLHQHPLCCYCEREGRVSPASVVDHRIPHQGDDALFWDESNWQPLCKPCHDTTKAHEERDERGRIRYAFMPDWLEPVPTLTLVFGPPGSGKTTYVREHAGSDDVVLDLDEIAARVGARPLYLATADDRALAVRERNRQLMALAQNPRPAWLILTAGTPAQRRWWTDKLKPLAVLVMDTPKAECVARITRDSRRREDVKTRHIMVVESWH